MRSLLYGVGMNDADYKVSRYEKIDGSHKQVWRCPFYQRWKNMMERCYCKKYTGRNPTYFGCSVCPDWLMFSEFKAWVELQDWSGNHLDKDILIPGNKVYSPETCAFVSGNLNLFLSDCRARKGRHATGVYFDKAKRKYHARCSNPFTKKHEHLGYFNCEGMAHDAWRRRKHELACQYADMQADPRVAEALRLRFVGAK